MESRAEIPLVFSYRETDSYYKGLLEENLVVCGGVTLAWLISETETKGILAIHSLQYKKIKAEHKFLKDTLFLYHTEGGWMRDKKEQIHVEKIATNLSSLLAIITNDLHLTFPSEARIHPAENDVANAYANYTITRSIKNKYTSTIPLSPSNSYEIILPDDVVKQMQEKFICPVMKKKMQNPILIKHEVNIYIKCLFKNQLLVLQKGHSYDKAILKKFKGIDIRHEENVLLKNIIEQVGNKNKLKNILQDYSQKSHSDNVILQSLLDMVNPRNRCNKKS